MLDMLIFLPERSSGICLPPGRKAGDDAAKIPLKED